ncbi:MAG TPA: fibronectin type III domain-containing protein [Acidobacteriaceae bacterium]|nr:fibronectin type III domain-containing protein [Acidobacteriaceae bacterium]
MKKCAAWGIGPSAGLLWLVGCALAGNPQPPTLWMPEPVRDLSGIRVGNDVHLHWTMPKNTTDKVALQGNQRAHICWLPGAAPSPHERVPPRPVPSTGLPGCQPAGDRVFPPNRPADFTAQLPAELLSEPPGVVSYFVELQNPSGKTAGPSNPAYVATGSAPPTVDGLSANAQATGVVLHWLKASFEPGLVLRIHRTPMTTPGAPKTNPAAGVPPSAQQTLEVDLGKGDPGQALDHDAVLDHTWQYTVERVRRQSADHQVIEVAGPPSPAITINAKDVFPPAIPTGLAAVADEQAHAIELSWTPDTDPDLAGYVVYRHDEAGAIQRISGTSLIVATTFTDRNVMAGRRYAYAVSAVDHDGNESARSAEVEEQISQQENAPQ